MIDFSYLWQLFTDPGIRMYALQILVSVILFLSVISIMVSVNGRYADDIDELEEQELPYRTFRFSNQCELLVYNEGVVITRNGTAVSPMLTDVWDVTWNDDAKDRVLSTRRMTDSGPVSDKIHVGPLDVIIAMRVRETILHYVGG